MIELGKFRHDEQISNEVKDGSIAYALTRPYEYLVYHFFNGLGETLVKMVLILLLGFPIAWWSVGLPMIAWSTLPAVGLVLFLALVLDFVEWLQGIARVLPFSQVTYGPAKLFVAFSGPQFWQILVMQVFWIAVLGWLLRRQYRWAVRRLEVNGG